MECPCGSGRTESDCCLPIITGERPATTAEALMRARYTAYTRGDVDFVMASMEAQRRAETDEDGIRAWSEESEWLGLEIREVVDGGPEDETGIVEFVASYEHDDEEIHHHERARFVQIDGRWYFVDGEKIRARPFVRETPKTGRNDPCPCGSGRKFKKCCGI